MTILNKQWTIVFQVSFLMTGRWYYLRKVCHRVSVMYDPFSLISMPIDKAFCLIDNICPLKWLDEASSRHKSCLEASTLSAMTTTHGWLWPFHCFLTSGSQIRPKPIEKSFVSLSSAHIGDRRQMTNLIQTWTLKIVYHKNLEEKSIKTTLQKIYLLNSLYPNLLKDHDCVSFCLFLCPLCGLNAPSPSSLTWLRLVSFENISMYISGAALLFSSFS